MPLTPIQTLIILGMVTLGTLITRFLPFLLFRGANSEHPYISYLGEALPYAAVGLLVVYCLKGVTFNSPSGWAPEALAVAVIVALHAWKSNTLISIGVGTILYMFLVQVVFI